MKTIVITGANKGVGLTLVKHFISDFKVVALSKSYDNLINVKSDNLTFHCVDVSDLSRMKDVFKSITNIDYLIRATKLAKKYDFILAVDECYIDIYRTALPKPVGCLDALIKMNSN